MGDRPQLLGHRKPILSETALGRPNLEVKAVAKVGSGQRDGKREAEARLV